MRDILVHHGILGQKWGIRRYQNPDGSLTSAGKKRYGDGKGGSEKYSTKKSRESRNSSSTPLKNKIKDVATDPRTVAAVGVAIASLYGMSKVSGKYNWGGWSKGTWVKEPPTSNLYKIAKRVGVKSSSSVNKSKAWAWHVDNYPDSIYIDYGKVGKAMYDSIRITGVATIAALAGSEYLDKKSKASKSEENRKSR